MSNMLIFCVDHPGTRSSRASPVPSPTSLRRLPATPIMSETRLISYLEEMKRKFWEARRHLQPDEINRQWTAKTAPYTNILRGTEAQTLPLELTSTQAPQMARHSTSKSCAETPARRRGSVRPQLDPSAFLLEGADAGIGNRPFRRIWATLLRSSCVAANV